MNIKLKTRTKIKLHNHTQHTTDRTENKETLQCMPKVNRGSHVTM